MKVSGGCHCGNISYHYSTNVEIEEMPVRVCRCSFCTRHGNRYTSDPEGHLGVTIKRSDQTAEYRFGSGTTRSLFCTNCGVMPLMTLITEGRLYAIINVNTADQSFEISKAETFDYSHESAEQSIARRKKKWISNVEIRKAK